MFPSDFFSRASNLVAILKGTKACLLWSYKLQRQKFLLFLHTSSQPVIFRRLNKKMHIASNSSYVGDIFRMCISSIKFSHEAGHLRIDALKLWCWRRLLRVPWTARRSNQSILKEINPQCSLEGLILKLKLQYFGHLMWKSDSLEKSLMLRQMEGRRKRGPQRMRWLEGITDAMNMNSGKLWEVMRKGDAWCAAVHGVAELDMTRWLHNNNTMIDLFLVF